MSDLVFCPPNVDCPCYAGLVDEAKRLREANELMLTDIRRTDVDMLAFKARIEQLEAYALKAFTVVEFCAGEGLLLPHPHYDCDDLLMEGVDLLKVETSEEARAELVEKMTDEQAIEAVKKRRRKLLLSVLEVSLGDLVQMDGIEKVKKYLNEFERQLTEY